MKKIICSLLAISTLTTSTAYADTSLISVKLKNATHCESFSVSITSNDISKGNTYFLNISNNENILANNIITVIAEPKPGYKFCCWLNGNYIDSLSNKYSFKVTENTDLKAIFVSENFSGIYPYRFVVLDANGGTFSDGSSRILGKFNIDIFNKKFNFPPEEPTKPHCSFIGYNTKPTGKGSWINENTIIDGSDTFYAIYKENNNLENAISDE